MKGREARTICMLFKKLATLCVTLHPFSFFPSFLVCYPRSFYFSFLPLCLIHWLVDSKRNVSRPVFTTRQKSSYLLREEQRGIFLFLVMNLLSLIVCKHMILLKLQPNWGTNSPLMVFSHLLNDIPKSNACFPKEKLWHSCSWPASPADWTGNMYSVLLMLSEGQTEILRGRYQGILNWYIGFTCRKIYNAYILYWFWPHILQGLQLGCLNESPGIKCSSTSWLDFIKLWKIPTIRHVSDIKISYIVFSRVQSTRTFCEVSG